MKTSLIIFRSPKLSVLQFLVYNMTPSTVREKCTVSNAASIWIEQEWSDSIVNIEDLNWNRLWSVSVDVKAYCDSLDVFQIYDATNLI